MALDLVRRRPDDAPGAVDLCIAAAIEEAGRLGLKRVSLGSVPLRDAAGDATDGWIIRPLRALAYRRGHAGYRYASLARFKDKFATQWESRDIALPHGPRAVLALITLLRLHRAPDELAARERAQVDATG